MLKGEPEDIDLLALRDHLLETLALPVEMMISDEDKDAIEVLSSAEAVDIRYPVLEYPEKVRALNFDKTHEIHGQLLGIKGQYLILDKGVINIRKFGGYHVRLSY
jgi:hypothetical protein